MTLKPLSPQNDGFGRPWGHQKAKGPETYDDYLKDVAAYNEWYSSPAGIAERQANIVAAAGSLGLTVDEFERRVNANLRLDVP